jgi:ribosome biogenesis GTPase A
MPLSMPMAVAARLLLLAFLVQIPVLWAFVRGNSPLLAISTRQRQQLQPRTPWVLGAKKDMRNEEINVDYSQYHAEWEEEGREIQAELEEERKRKEEEEAEEELDLIPDYAKKWFEEMGGALEDDSPTPMSKLPTIVVMGRPNTGKSTIVNRLTNSFKAWHFPSSSHLHTVI